MKGPYVTPVEDGSTHIEWVGEGKRFYIIIEPDLKESSWGYVAKVGENEPPEACYGDLPDELLEAFAARAEVERLKAERDVLRNACRTMYAYLSPEWDAAKADLYNLARSQGQTMSEYVFSELKKALAHRGQ